MKMAKRIGFNPLILLGDTPGDDTVIGGGTGQGGVKQPTAMSFEQWLNSEWREDLILDGTVDIKDYATWWESWGFDMNLWSQLNPNNPWPFDD
jgi:hypothetical protein